jgi:hypothetical protein
MNMQTGPVSLGNHEKIKTGDLILESDEGAIAPFIKVLTFSNYNHCTVGIRLDITKLPEIKVVRTGGVLFVLEPKLHKFWIADSLKSKADFKADYSTLIYPLKDELYTSEFEHHVTNYLYNNCKYIVYNGKQINIKEKYNENYNRRKISGIYKYFMLGKNRILLL